MSSSDAYYADLVLSWCVRVGLYTSILAVLAIAMLGCSRPGVPDILPSMSADKPLQLSRGENDNRDSESTTHKGCDEKSDSALKKPLL